MAMPPFDPELQPIDYVNCIVALLTRAVDMYSHGPEPRRDVLRDLIEISEPLTATQNRASSAIVGMATLVGMLVDSVPGTMEAIQQWALQSQISHIEGEL